MYPPLMAELKKIYVARNTPRVQEILLTDGNNIYNHTIKDYSLEQKANAQRKQEIGKGWWGSKDGMEMGECDMGLLLADPDGQEWWKTRNPKALDKFLSRHPWCRTSTAR